MEHQKRGTRKKGEIERRRKTGKRKSMQARVKDQRGNEKDGVIMHRPAPSAV
jgi:hypothetical protein